MDKVFELACDFYDLLEANAKPEVIEGVTLKVFTGNLTYLFKQMETAQSYYGAINSALRDLGCTSLIRRGSRGYPSRLALHHRPVETEYIIFRNRPLTQSPESATLLERLVTVEKRLGGLDIGEALEDFEKRISKLERIREANGNGT